MSAEIIDVHHCSRLAGMGMDVLGQVNYSSFHREQPQMIYAFFGA